MSFLGLWIQCDALQTELQAVEEKHLLLAKNISRSLSRYAVDLDAIFIAKSEAKPTPFPSEIQTLMHSVHIQMLILVDRPADRPVDRPVDNAAIAYRMGTQSFLPADGLASLNDETAQALKQPEKTVISPVTFNQQGQPTLYLVRVTRDRQLAIAAVSPDYFKQVQQNIAFGEKGHAVIVDQTGQVIAHPSPSWESSAKDMSALAPVQLMMAQDTGVTKFYSPAVQETMIAGYSFVPATGWGVMIPQPYREVQALADQTTIVALRVSLLGLLLAIFVSWRLTSYLLEPIRAVIRASRALTAGDNIDELVIQHQWFPREIENLLKTFDQMATEVSWVRATLEHRVQARTQELVKEVERRKQLEQQLIQNATHDVLTGLPNRRLLTERLQSTIDVSRLSQHAIALLFIDLDGFKKINDTHGHQVGDRLLVQVAKRLRVSLRKSDSIFRLGGDEFVIVAEQINAIETARNLAQDLLETIQKPFTISGCKITIGGSIGIKMSDIGRHETADEILADADDAMYRAKEKGNCAIVHTVVC